MIEAGLAFALRFPPPHTPPPLNYQPKKKYLCLSAGKNKQIRIFAKSRNVRHNKSIDNRDERKDDYGVCIHNAGRLSDTGSGAAGGRDAHRQIWDVAQDIPEKSQERNIRRPDDVGKIEQLPDRNRPDSEGTNRDNHGEASGEQSGTGQNDRPDGLDGTYEQPAALSRRVGTDGAGLQLTLFPTV